MGIVSIPRGGGVGGFSTSTGFMPKRAIISADIVAMAATKLAAAAAAGSTVQLALILTQKNK